MIFIQLGTALKESAGSRIVSIKKSIVRSSAPDANSISNSDSYSYGQNISIVPAELLPRDAYLDKAKIQVIDDEIEPTTLSYSEKFAKAISIPTLTRSMSFRPVPPSHALPASPKKDDDDDARTVVPEQEPARRPKSSFLQMLHVTKAYRHNNPTTKPSLMDTLRSKFRAENPQLNEMVKADRQREAVKSKEVTEKHKKDADTDKDGDDKDKDKEASFEYFDPFAIREDFKANLVLYEDEMDIHEKIINLLESKRGRQHFSSYMKLTLSNESFSFFQGAHVVLMLDMEDVNEAAEEIALEYMNTSAADIMARRVNAAEALKSLKPPDENVMLQVFRDLIKAQREVIKMVVMGCITKYIHTEEYRRWVEEEESSQSSQYSSRLSPPPYAGGSSPMKHGPPDSSNSSPSRDSGVRKNRSSGQRRPSLAGIDPLALEGQNKNNQSRDSQGSQDYANIGPETGLAVKSIAFFEMGTLDGCLVSDKWLTSLIQCCESLPLSMSIASASPKKPGFPLIYVNHNFIKISGYDKSEILGRNCKFLQDTKAEPDSILRMRDALRQALPVKVHITNRSKQGKYFRNLLAMKPLFDQHGSYRYVLGCQFSLSNNELFNHSNFILLQQILKMFPDTILSSVQEEDGQS